MVEDISLLTALNRGPTQTKPAAKEFPLSMLKRLSMTYWVHFETYYTM